MTGQGGSDLTPDRIIELLGLEPLPEEGGMWTQTWIDEHGSAIHFLLRPHDFSALHRLQGPELWHFHCGWPVEMVLLTEPSTVDRPVLGVDLEAGQRPTVAVPARTWMGARTTGHWSLIGTTMAPPYRAEEFELGSRAELGARFPDALADIAALTREGAS